MSKINIGIVASEFNYDLTQSMIGLAKEEADFLEVGVPQVVTVPGVFDMPLAVKKLLDGKKLDGIVTLGAVIEGQTQHDEIVAQHAARKIMDLGLDYGKPVTLGITGPGMSRIEAHTRVRNAKHAMDACVKMVKRLREM
ncbi:MAG: 6,7-dimethyl-8-ribityllumazine synthase [Candidatus Altiarchaeota archaeon]